VIIVQENRIFNNHDKIEFKPVSVTTISDPQRNARGCVAASNRAGKIPRTCRRAISYNLLRPRPLYKCNLGTHELLDRRFKRNAAGGKLSCDSRVGLPSLRMSPYGKQGIDSHVQSEHGSFLKSSTSAQTSLKGRSFGFSQMPRKFVRISKLRNETFFERQSIAQRPADTDLNPQ
jgi:hypothetical protein